MVHLKNVEFLQITMNNFLLFYFLFLFTSGLWGKGPSRCVSVSLLKNSWINKLYGGFSTKTSYIYCVFLTPDQEPLAHIPVVELVSEDEMSEVEPTAQVPPKWVSFCEAHGGKGDIVRCKLGALSLLKV